jgi:hypothetical protein
VYDGKAAAPPAGAHVDGAPDFDPLDVAYADGRLFVIDDVASAVRIFDVAMDPTAVAAPILTLQPICVIDSNAVPELVNPFAIITTASTPSLCSGSARVFVCNSDSSTIVEMTREGTRVRTFAVDTIDRPHLLGLGDGDGDGSWLFACSRRLRPAPLL